MDISIIMPAYNEEKIIKNTILRVHRVIPESEIIVVSDGSTDGTVKIVKKMKNKISNLKVIELKERQGKGAAILKGFTASRGKIIGFLDADDAFDIYSIREMIKFVQSKKYDCVIASKWKESRFHDVNATFMRKIASRIWNFIVRIMFNINFKDTQAGAKFLRKEVFDNIGNNFCCKGFEMDVELLWKILKSGYSIGEIPIKYTNRKETKFRMVAAISMLLNIIKLKISEVK